MVRQMFLDILVVYIMNVKGFVLVHKQNKTKVLKRKKVEVMVKETFASLLIYLLLYLA